MNQWDVVVIGGGPAGCAATTAVARDGARVALLERGRYPRHKVCGEFVSAESLGLLEQLLERSGQAALLQHAPRIDKARIYVGPQVLEGAVRPPAASLPRFALDAALWQAARESGAECRQQVHVGAIEHADGFRVHGSAGTYAANAVIDASGRWSNLGPRIPASAGKPQWLGLKAHFAAPDAPPPDTTELYIFAGGYCGVQPVWSNEAQQLRLNVCAMVRNDIATDLAGVFRRHRRLAERSRAWAQATELVATSPLLFQPARTERDGAFLAGDAAAFIDPFVGDGISIALRSGTLAGEMAAHVGRREWTLPRALEEYGARYRAAFGPAFRHARHLRRLMQMPNFLRAPVVQLLRLPGVTEFLIRKTRAARDA